MNLFIGIRCTASVLSVLLFFTSSISAAQFKLRTDRDHGLYETGETVTWSIEVIGDKEGETLPQEADFCLRSNGLEILDEGKIAFKEGKAAYSSTRNDEGTLLLVVKASGAKSICGAAFNAKNIKSTISRPDDFQEFWNTKLEEAGQVNLDPILTAETMTEPGVELWQVSFNNILGSRVHGQLAKPEFSDRKLPAMLILQWAGVYGLKKSWVTKYAAQGWLVLNILPHDLPIYEPKSFYKEQSQGPLKNYQAIGSSDRETSYFLRMYLSCFQAVRYLESRPDWDGEVLVVSGTSQGGLQALVTAALCPDVVSAVLAEVPAGCDQQGRAFGRSVGWPRWYSAAKGPDGDKVMQTASYYDAVNFCPDIICPTLIGMGLGDTTSAAPGIFRAVNEITGPVEVVTMPEAGHQHTRLNPHDVYRSRSQEWLKVLRTGDEVLLNEW